jgi:hypothetical protein
LPATTAFDNFPLVHEKLSAVLRRSVYEGHASLANVFIPVGLLLTGWILMLLLARRNEKESTFRMGSITEGCMGNRNK